MEEGINDARFAAMREQMVEQIAQHCAMVHDHTGKPALASRVMDTLGRVPRHEFVPAELRPYAYLDSPLPIGFGKTVSQPFIVALMTDLLELTPEDRVLEIGTGLGYQAAILAELCKRIYTVEIIEELARRAQAILSRMGYDNIQIRIGDGSVGWGEHGPYDKVIVTAAPELIPPMLLQQLKPGGRMIIPAGLPASQMLTLVQKDSNGRIRTHDILPVRFSTLESDELD